VLKPSVCLAILAGLLAAAYGCYVPMIDVGLGQNFALMAALRRGQYELACPWATATVLSSNLLQAIKWGGAEASEYTVGVSGCGRATTYIVTCPQNGPDCFAGAPAGGLPGGR
jgi:hypothetical protein